MTKESLTPFSHKWHISEFLRLPLEEKLLLLQRYSSKVFGYTLSKKIIEKLKENIDKDCENLYFDLKNGYAIVCENDYIQFKEIKRVEDI